jgi:PHD/YefM family antitoxin component YafN of YafNO toxin-antitoxin module
MQATTFSRTDLTRKTREILELVRRGQPAVIESYGREQAVLLDPLDYRLLQALAGLGSGQTGNQDELQALLQRYLRDDVSLAKMAGSLGVSRFELMERFERLGVPVRSGPADLAEAREEVATARSHE